MSGFFSYRMVLALIIGGVLIWHIYVDEKETFSTEPNIYAYGCLLLVYMASLSLVLLLIDEWESAWNQILYGSREAIVPKGIESKRGCEN